MLSENTVPAMRRPEDQTPMQAPITSKGAQRLRAEL
jgi:hypothetical protein